MDNFKYQIPTKLFIHGEYVDSKGDERLSLRSSVSDEVISKGEWASSRSLTWSHKLI